MEGNTDKGIPFGTQSHAQPAASQRPLARGGSPINVEAFLK